MSRFSNLEFEGAGERRPTRSGQERDDLRVLEEARLAFENAEFERALRLCSKAIEFNPHEPTAWAGQVRALIELGEYSEANLWADKALERFPGETEILAAKAVALGRLGQFDEALALSDTSVQQAGELPYVWLARGDVLLARQESIADFCFDKALLLESSNWVTRWLAARIRTFYRQFAIALKLVHQALELRADHAILWLLAGQCQRELGLFAAARNSFSHALQLDPGCHEARNSIIAIEGTGVGSRLASWWRRQFRR